MRKNTVQIHEKKSDSQHQHVAGTLTLESNEISYWPPSKPYSQILLRLPVPWPLRSADSALMTDLDHSLKQERTFLKDHFKTFVKAFLFVNTLAVSAFFFLLWPTIKHVLINQISVWEVGQHSKISAF